MGSEKVLNKEVVPAGGHATARGSVFDRLGDHKRPTNKANKSKVLNLPNPNYKEGARRNTKGK